MIELKEVQSSNIEAIGFDEEKQNLYIMFSGGSLYEYNPIEKKVYEAFMLSNSFGKFFYAIIKANKEYKYKKVDFDLEKFQMISFPASGQGETND